MFETGSVGLISGNTAMFFYALYNFDSLKPHFYIVKLGFKGVYTIFLISVQKHRLCYFILLLLKDIDCRYSLELPCQDGSIEYTQFMF